MKLNVIGNAPLLCVVATMIFMLQLPEASQARRNSFGEACNRTTRCDRKLHLSCSSGKCGCMKPEDMVFEAATGKCVTKAGHECKHLKENSNGKTVFEFTPCVEHAYCDSDGFCSCEESYSENLNGFCTLAVEALKECTADENCKSFPGLECINNMCVCNANTTVYSAVKEQCVGLAGQKCVDSKCTDNAACTVVGLCVCDKGYFTSDDGKCFRRLGIAQPCTADAQCQYEGTNLLKCVDGVCLCDPAISLYGTAQASENVWGETGFLLVHGYFKGFSGPSKTQCLGKVDMPCIDRLCVDNAFCSYPSSHDFTGFCKCQAAFSKTSDGLCGKAYGAPCSVVESCAAGLVCNLTQKKCSCRYQDQIYSKFDGKCQSKVGGPCGTDVLCVHNAECKKIPSSSHGVCACEPGYVGNGTRFCELEHGVKCDAGDSCDSFAKLGCIDGTCQCLNFGEYSPEHRKCLGLIGSLCDETDAEDRQCIKNAKCSSPHRGLPATCSCKPGFVLTEDYTCRPPPETVLAVVERY